jgi:hypothetical protein
MIVKQQSSWGHIFSYISPYHTAGFVFWNNFLLCMQLNWLLCFSYVFFHTQFWGDYLWFSLVKPQHILENQRERDICIILTELWKWHVCADRQNTKRKSDGFQVPINITGWRYSTVTGRTL